MPYREASDPSQGGEENDPEALAIATLRTRVRRLRTAIHAPLFLAGIAGGLSLYVLFREWQLTHRGAHAPWLTAICSMTPALGGALKLAPALAGAVVRWLLPRWRAALAKEHGLDLAELTETTRLLE